MANPTAVCAGCGGPIEYMPASADPTWRPPYWRHTGPAPARHTLVDRIADVGTYLINTFGPAWALLVLWLVPAAVDAGVL